LKKMMLAGSNVRGDTFPSTAPGVVANATFRTVPEPAIVPAPETLTKRRDVVASTGITLHVGLSPASPAIVPLVEHPKFGPDVFITVGLNKTLN
jgi:hypothetical protein